MFRSLFKIGGIRRLCDGLYYKTHSTLPFSKWNFIQLRLTHNVEYTVGPA